MVRSIVHPPAASATHPVEGRAQLVLAERSVLYMYVSGHGDKVRLEEEGALDGRPAQLLSHDVRVRLCGLLFSRCPASPDSWVIPRATSIAEASKTVTSPRTRSGHL